MHQAVHRLQAEGLLEILPRKGIIIRPDSLNEIFALLEARSAVEPNIAALAAERASRAQVREMERLLRQSKRYVDQRFRQSSWRSTASFTTRSRKRRATRSWSTRGVRCTSALRSSGT